MIRLMCSIFGGLTHITSIGYCSDHFMQCVCNWILTSLMYLLNINSVPLSWDDFLGFLLVNMISLGTKELSMVLVVAPISKKAGMTISYHEN